MRPMIGRTMRGVGAAAMLAFATSAQADESAFALPCADLQAVVDAARAESAFSGLNEPTSLGFRAPCRIQAGPETRRFSCRQFSGFTDEFYNDAVAQAASCLPEARRMTISDGTSGLGAPLTTRLQLPDVTITISLTGLMTRGGTYLHLIVGPDGD
jgi:hypothetical protein